MPEIDAAVAAPVETKPVEPKPVEPKPETTQALAQNFAAMVADALAERLKLVPVAKAKTATVKVDRRRGGVVPQKCPVEDCKEMTKARRFSFLCENHRSPANIKKFRGSRGIAH